MKHLEYADRVALQATQAGLLADELDRRNEPGTENLQAAARNAAMSLQTLANELRNIR